MNKKQTLKELKDYQDVIEETKFTLKYTTTKEIKHLELAEILIENTIQFMRRLSENCLTKTELRKLDEKFFGKKKTIKKEGVKKCTKKRKKR